MTSRFPSYTGDDMPSCNFNDNISTEDAASYNASTSRRSSRSQHATIGASLTSSDDDVLSSPSNPMGLLESPRTPDSTTSRRARRSHSGTKMKRQNHNHSPSGHPSTNPSLDSQSPHRRPNKSPPPSPPWTSSETDTDMGFFLRNRMF